MTSPFRIKPPPVNPEKPISLPVPRGKCPVCHGTGLVTVSLAVIRFQSETSAAPLFLRCSVCT